ncbi:ion transporter [Planctomycetes bacterium K23_9]|uniref:Cyclic nucleotide-gated potassium channel n=1 Tax=Stieleria marina TaxID=1930275 RepID=A0A517NWX6_9BACT|nr:Cyclic nucleotide-gated potassium channel [Planctomycetes bacterium K23_9]
MNSSNPPASERRRRTQRPDGPSRRATLYDIIFEADTPAGWWFDIGLLVAILLSVAIVAIETVPEFGYDTPYEAYFWGIELFLTFLFTVEYILRLACVRSPMRYAFSFWGIIDLLSILPTFATVFVGSGKMHSFAMLRSVRLLRVFRVLKLWRMMNDADELSDAIWKARNKIVVFLAVIMVAITISGTLMYYIENVLPNIVHDVRFGGLKPDDQPERPESRFTSIPQSMYWATVTMTTVGYGDITPQTGTGKLLSTILILLGYSLIIVPSGFVTAELTSRGASEHEAPCHRCEAGSQRVDAVYCYRCGHRLEHE